MAMREPEINQVLEAVRSLHHCEASIVDSVPAIEVFAGKTVFEGIVHIVRLEGNPVSDRCYAWLRAPPDDCQIVTMLHDGVVYSPQSAVRAMMLQEWPDRR